MAKRLYFRPELFDASDLQNPSLRKEILKDNEHPYFELLELADVETDYNTAKLNNGFRLGLGGPSSDKGNQEANLRKKKILKESLNFFETLVPTPSTVASTVAHEKVADYLFENLGYLAQAKWTSPTLREGLSEALDRKIEKILQNAKAPQMGKLAESPHPDSDLVFSAMHAYSLAFPEDPKDFRKSALAIWELSPNENYSHLLPALFCPLSKSRQLIEEHCKLKAESDSIAMVHAEYLISFILDNSPKDCAN